MSVTWAIVGAYVAGVALGLLVIDGRQAEKIGLALVWPIGPIAFVVTIALLLLASLVAFPSIGAGALVVGSVVWWALS